MLFFKFGIEIPNENIHLRALFMYCNKLLYE